MGEGSQCEDIELALNRVRIDKAKASFLIVFFNLIKCRPLTALDT